MLAPEKPSWAKRIQPVIGALLLIMGVFPLSLALFKGYEWSKLQPFLGGLLIGGGGASLLQRGTRGAQFWLYFVGALGLAVGGAWLASR